MKNENQEAVIRARVGVRKPAKPPEAVFADKPKRKITLEPWSVIFIMWNNQQRTEELK